VFRKMKSIDAHITSSKQLVMACVIALKNNQQASEVSLINVNNQQGKLLFSKTKKQLSESICRHRECINILVKMRNNHVITFEEFNQVIQLHDVRQDPICFGYDKVMDVPQVKLI
jgi:hypothetical protein